MQFVRFDTLDVRNQRFEILSLRSLKVEDPSCNLSKKEKEKHHWKEKWLKELGERQTKLIIIL